MRCRETIQREFLWSKHGVLKFLARRGQRFLEGKHWTKAHLAGLETLTATTSRSRSRMARRSTPWARSARIRARYGAARNGVVGRVTAGAVSANTACRRPASGTGPVSRWWVVAQTRYRRTVLRLTPRVAANRPLALAEVQSPRHLTNVQHVSFPSRHGPSQSKTPGAVLGHADRGKPTAGPLSGENGWYPIGRKPLDPYGENGWYTIGREVTAGAWIETYSTAPIRTDVAPRAGAWIETPDRPPPPGGGRAPRGRVD